MPEGDTLYRTAVGLQKALLNRVVVRFETSVQSVAAVHEKMPVKGRLISAIEARGKHLLISFRSPAARSDAEARFANSDVPPPEVQNLSAELLVLHTHLRMTGSWHIYRPDEKWRKPVRFARVVLYTDAFVAPCFSAPVVELLTDQQVRRHRELTMLGPDAIRDEFDPSSAFQRIRRFPTTPIGVALMNQQILAGVGNVYKSEVLFLQRISPFALVGELDDTILERLIAEAHKLLQLNRQRGNRRTLFSLSEVDRLWVYGRSGEPCRVCGELIRMRRQGLEARSTYYCGSCQNAA